MAITSADTKRVANLFEGLARGKTGVFGVDDMASVQQSLHAFVSEKNMKIAALSSGMPGHVTNKAIKAVVIETVCPETFAIRKGSKCTVCSRRPGKAFCNLFGQMNICPSVQPFASTATIDSHYNAYLDVTKYNTEDARFAKPGENPDHHSQDGGLHLVCNTCTRKLVAIVAINNVVPVSIGIVASRLKERWGSDDIMSMNGGERFCEMGPSATMYNLVLSTMNQVVDAMRIAADIANEDFTDAVYFLLPKTDDDIVVTAMQTLRARSKFYPSGRAGTSMELWQRQLESAAASPNMPPIPNSPYLRKLPSTRGHRRTHSDAKGDTSAYVKFGSMLRRWFHQWRVARYMTRLAGAGQYRPVPPHSETVVESQRERVQRECEAKRVEDEQAKKVARQAVKQAKIERERARVAANRARQQAEATKRAVDDAAKRVANLACAAVVERVKQERIRREERAAATLMRVIAMNRKAANRVARVIREREAAMNREVAPVARPAKQRIFCKGASSRPAAPEPGESRGPKVAKPVVEPAPPETPGPLLPARTAPKSSREAKVARKAERRARCNKAAVVLTRTVRGLLARRFARSLAAARYRADIEKAIQLSIQSVTEQPHNEPPPAHPLPASPVTPQSAPSLALECAVCLDACIDPHAIVDCGHLFCGKCVKSLTSCATCRAQITKVVRLYM